MPVDTRLKVMLFSHICTPTHITGAEKFLLFYIQELRQYHDCLLVVPNEGILSVEARARGITVLTLRYPLLWAIYSPGPFIEQQFEQFVRQGESTLGIMQIINAHKPDYVVANTCVNVMPPVVATAMGVPVIWMITETLEEGPYTPLSVDIINRHSSRIIGISSSTLQSFQGAGIEEKKFILYPSWNKEELEPGGWEYYRQVKRAEISVLPHEPLVGYISSNIYPNKGLDHFINMALGICVEIPDVKFVIIGTPSNQDFYALCLERIRQSGYGHRFSVLSFVLRTQEIYPAMDVVVIPSLQNEGFGMTALEGMIFQKPVIAYASGGLEEILNHTGNSAYLVPKGNADGLLQTIRPLLYDPAVRQNAGMHNGQAAEQIFGVMTYRQRLQDWLAQLHNLMLYKDMRGEPSLPTSILGRVVIRSSKRRAYILHQGIRYSIQTPASSFNTNRTLQKSPNVPATLVAQFPESSIPYHMTIEDHKEPRLQRRSKRKKIKIVRKKVTGKRLKRVRKKPVQKKRVQKKRSLLIPKRTKRRAVNQVKHVKVRRQASIKKVKR
ncbi:glycosyltransferase [Paenibacillus sp. N1-5-1-14]|uniref:glycosyltransferase family 4 protein n=1 Tax=Paenibacillus radicibacter TaxID=2972488 RepID=UPI00215983E9|nr:glycosyltransferase [Paenibacillus radicibacter]MCR8645196.1 glycosyltransferase [Paenibacillus radicibacter]